MRIMGRVVAVVVSICLTLSGCCWWETSSPSDPPYHWVEDLETFQVFNGDQVTLRTDEAGQMGIDSDSLGVTYMITFLDDHGNPIPNYVLDYTEIASRSVLHGYDPDGVYMPFVLSGTPDYIQSMFRTVSPDRAARSLIGGTIVLIVTIGLLGYTQVQFIMNGMKVKKFYYETAVDYYDGQLLLETTFDELAEDYLAPRVDGVLNLVDIGMTFIMAGASKPVGHLYSIAGDLAGHTLMTIASELRSRMLEAAIESWGISMDEAIDKTIYVVVEMEEKDNGFKKMYASYRIYYSDPRGQSIWRDSFESVSTYADPDPLFWTVVESGTSDIFVTTVKATDGLKSAEFNDGSNDDYCYMVGDLGNVQSGWFRWDWCVDQLGSFGFQVWSGSSSYSWDTVNIYLNFRPDGQLYCMYSNTGGLEEPVFSYVPGRWYEMELYFDCATDTLDLYVNGVKRLRQHKFWNPTTGITNFRFIAFSNASIEQAWVDNIVVSASPSEWSPSIARSTRSMDALVVSDESFSVGQ